MVNLGQFDEAAQRGDANGSLHLLCQRADATNRRRRLTALLAE
jgi:hypothetical protein